MATIYLLVNPGIVLAEDCNWNGIDDTVDISIGTSQDCNNNGIPDECDISRLYAGTQDGGIGGGAKVYRYVSGTIWTDISPATWSVSAVMDLAFYNGHLYAGVQTEHGFGGGSGEGQIWRYDGENTWTQIGTMDTSAMVLEILDNKLYAATTNYNEPKGRLYRCEQCDGSD
jgi:hypothetical protein